MMVGGGGGGLIASMRLKSLDNVMLSGVKSRNLHMLYLDSVVLSYYKSQVSSIHEPSRIQLDVQT